MSLQELTSALRQKEDDKSAVIKSIQQLKELSEKGVVGRLMFHITECFFNDMKFDIEVHPETAYVPVGENTLLNKVNLDFLVHFVLF